MFLKVATATPNPLGFAATVQDGRVNEKRRVAKCYLPGLDFSVWFNHARDLFLVRDWAVKTNTAEQNMIISDMAGDKDANDKVATAGENKVECVSSFVGMLLHKLTPTNLKKLSGLTVVSDFDVVIEIANNNNLQS